VISKPFEVALTEYLAFKEKAVRVLTPKLESDYVALQAAQQILEPLFFRALEWNATASEYYYKAKASALERWIMEEARAVSTATEAAKARCSQELWMMLDSEGVVRATESRKISVSQSLKLMGKA
jgi:hypothetical protein